MKRRAILRPRDLAVHGVYRQTLRRMVKKGMLRRFGRGLYGPVDSELSQFHSFAEACKRVPHGVICLMSALVFHDLTTQAPFEVWMAIDRKGRQPKSDVPRMRFIRYSGAAFSEGIEEQVIEGVPVRVFSAAKTVADCFKFRNKFGRDVAIEALKDCYRRRVCSLGEIWRYAKVCRMTRVIVPYLEAID